MWVELTRVTIQVGGIHTGGKSGFESGLEEPFGLMMTPLFLFLDNELPDYIMVMLANNKTITQISNDLQLFLSGNTDKFTSWLQEAITNPDILRNKGDPVESES